MDRALTPEQKEIFENYSDIDFSLEFENATGRVNVGYANARKMHLVMRYLRADIIPIDQIGLDVPMLKKMCDHGLGVIMVAGETSSGKTTTITAMLDYINHQRFGSIQTIENPVEYSMTSNKCLITRREIGRDTPDFMHALRASVRKNPDVLLIGEVRDTETANIALTAAETGIQTFCTIHAIGAIPAITRLRNILASGEKSAAEFYQRLSHCLAAIISQQLIKTCDNSGVLPVYEILNMGYAEKNYLRDGDFPRLEHSLETDHNISMGHCVYRLWHSTPRRINEDTIRRLYGDQFRLMMNRLDDVKGWKPMGTGI
jgi:twitching motility protein PilT